MSVSQLDLWVRKVMKGRREGREGGREERREGEWVTCLDVALCVSLRLASSPPCRNLSIDTVKSKAWASCRRGGMMMAGPTLGAGRQVAAP